MKSYLLLLGSFISFTCVEAQTIVGLPTLSQLDSTVFELRFKTDSAAVITVHASEDSTYRNAFVFLGRTVGDENEAAIRMDGLRFEALYRYRIFIGTELNLIGGTFTTRPLPKK